MTSWPWWPRPPPKCGRVLAVAVRAADRELVAQEHERATGSGLVGRRRGSAAPARARSAAGVGRGDAERVAPRLLHAAAGEAVPLRRLRRLGLDDARASSWRPRRRRLAHELDADARAARRRARRSRPSSASARRSTRAAPARRRRSSGPCPPAWPGRPARRSARPARAPRRRRRGRAPSRARLTAPSGTRTSTEVLRRLTGAAATSSASPSAPAKSTSAVRRSELPRTRSSEPGRTAPCAPQALAQSEPRELGLRAHRREARRRRLLGAGVGVAAGAVPPVPS